MRLTLLLAMLSFATLTACGDEEDSGEEVTDEDEE